VRLLPRLFASSLLVVAACGGQQHPNEAPTPKAPDRPLGALVAQQVIVAPIHSLSEVEALCDRVAILRLGRLVEIGMLDEIRHLSAVSVEALFTHTPPDVSRIPGVTAVTVTGDVCVAR